MTSERIYIGGFDPILLPGIDIVKRVQQNDAIEIEQIMCKEGKPFVHLRATSKDPQVKAFDIISKAFNNVKWKGCRLSVQEARPHFLERLAEERNEQPPIEEEKPQQQKQQRRQRRLRIRRRFGVEAFHIDTKPCEVEDWPNLRRALQRMQRRRDKHAIQQKALQKNRPNRFERQQQAASSSMAFLNRAVHFRFPKDGDVPADLVDDEQDLGDEVSMSSSSDDDSSSSDDSVASVDDEVLVEAKKESSAYAWSEDESDDDSADDEDASNSNPGQTMIVTNDETKKVSSESDHDNNESDDEASESAQEEVTIAKDEMVDDDQTTPVSQIKPETSNKNQQNTYQWSDDSDSDDSAIEDGLTYKKRNNKSLQTNINTNSEFDAAMDFGGNFEYSYNNDHPLDSVEQNEKAYSTDIQADVETNLNLLSTMFPDMAETKPAEVKPEHANSEDEDEDAASKKDSSGWSKSGVMLRYDPTKATSERFEVKEVDEDNNSDNKDDVDKESVNEDKTTTPSDSDEASSASTHDSSQEEEEADGGSNDEEDSSKKLSTTTTTTKDSRSDHLYEQNALESVFRSAREAWEGDVTTTNDVNSNAQDQTGDTKEEAVESGGNDSGGNFSFSFDLGKTPPDFDTKNASNGNFTFSFLADNEKKFEQKSKEGSDTDAIQNPNKQLSFRRKGHVVPQSVLDNYVAEFYKMNGGERIIEDSRAWDREEDQWKGERESLTLDWKRKRKFALSAMERRRKYR